MVPTTRTYGLLLALGVIATLQSTFSDGPSRLGLAIFTLLVLDGAVLLAMVWDGWQVRSQRAQITRSPLHRLSIGRDNPLTLTLQPGSRAAELRIYDHYPAEFEGTPMPLVASIPVGQPAELTYTVNPKHRGEYAWGDLQVQQRGPLGLAWADWRLPLAGTVAVYPDLIGLRQLSIRLALQSTGTLRQQRQLGVGTEFAELREYGTGDDPRFIDWKATARHSAPLVRVLEPEREQTLIVLLDRGRLMTAQVQGLSRFDWGLNAALALALAGIHRGDRVGIGVFDRTLHSWLPPKGGQPYLQQMIERLTPLQPVLLESDYLGAVTQIVKQQHRRALVVVLTDVVDQTASAELLSALVRLRPRYLPFCVTLRDPEVDRRAQTFQTQVGEAYSRAVALDLLAQRQAVFTRLQQRGVLVLDAPANRITDPLVEAYLRIKNRSRL
ncbi:DUF58 domain-containing protein [Pseudanabaena sp. FACHB-2040]|uniref:DUF58 domain-containing protein n=1 Tax=Pseudanabaena sp. FACHB-2040 TaxID=2692859 RepID=UPI001682156A|nr:DUF58 domain-containing protein [Pseudanabaena sp. FACHB-2040]MBD2260357.1 DUF58 domain-containing protein [Pseudanabaena sp. FACHB-2040]